MRRTSPSTPNSPSSHRRSVRPADGHHGSPNTAHPRCALQYRKAALAIAIVFVICGISLGSARADDHDRDRQQYEDQGRRHGDSDWQDHRGDRRGRGRREHDAYVRYYEPAPEVYYAPPVVVYPPPRPSSGISFFFPIWIR
jgi:hypothetical protein